MLQVIVLHTQVRTFAKCMLMCESEWHRDEHDLICPSCYSDDTEIVSLSLCRCTANTNQLQITPESDPRSVREAPSIPPDFQTLRDHIPWQDADSDPEEADIEEHITRGSRGSLFASRTIQSGQRVHTTQRINHPSWPNSPQISVNEFQTMVGNMLGPGSFRKLLAYH